MPWKHSVNVALASLPVGHHMYQSPLGDVLPAQVVRQPSKPRSREQDRANGARIVGEKTSAGGNVHELVATTQRPLGGPVGNVEQEVGRQISGRLGCAVPAQISGCRYQQELTTSTPSASGAILLLVSARDTCTSG